jgi:hypothetical protein
MQPKKFLQNSIIPILAGAGVTWLDAPGNVVHRSYFLLACWVLLSWDAAVWVGEREKISHRFKVMLTPVLISLAAITMLVCVRALVLAKLQEQQEYVWNNLTISAYMPPNGDITMSDFTIKNQGTADVYVGIMGCGINSITWKDGLRTSGVVVSFDRDSAILPGGDVIVRPNANRIIGGGGDGISTECLAFMRLKPPPEPPSSLACADVTVHLLYSLSAAESPDVIKFSNTKNTVQYQIPRWKAS